MTSSCITSALLVAVLACGCAHHNTATLVTTSRTDVATNPTQRRVRVTCEPRYYVVGWFGGDEFTLVRHPDTNQVWEVYAIVLSVTAPAEHAGKVLTMHHDGVLASGYA